MKTQKELILGHIRTACGLRVLEVGSHIKIRRGDLMSRIAYQTVGEDYWLDTFAERYHISEFEIIGLPVHLEHLLRAIGSKDGKTMMIDSQGSLYQGGVTSWQIEKRIDYDLTKSVERNLEDSPELCDMVAGLLGVNGSDK